MNFRKTLLQLLWVLVFVLVPAITAFTQNKQQVRLLDRDSGLPIQEATFSYGNQNDISDETGAISFSYEQGLVMKLSHLNYGAWELSDAQVQTMIKQKACYCKSKNIDLYPVTVIAMHAKQSPNAGMKLGYQDKMAHDGAEVLNQLPAINSIRKSGNYGADPVFRGFKYDQLNIVINGAQSASAACPNRMDPPTSQMAPNMLERVEVLKGPHVLRYGTGFGATVNFIPPPLKFSNQADVYGRASAGYEGNGEAITTEAQLGFNGKKYDVSFFGAWAEGNDYKAGNGNTMQGDYQRGSFGTRLGLKVASNQTLRLSTVYNMARDVDFPALPMDLREDNTWLINARHDIQINKENLKLWNTTVYASFVDHLMDNLLKPLDPRMMNATTPAKTHNYGMRTEGSWQFTNSSLFAGADWRLEGAEGTRIREFLMGPNAGKTVKDNAWQASQINKMGLFGEYHITGGDIKYVVSTRLEVNSAQAKDPSDGFIALYPETDVTQFNPSFSVGASKKVSDKAKVGLWLGRAQRSAGLTERYINFFPVGQDPYEMLGNPELDAEKNNQADLTFDWASNTSSINVNVFASYMQDFISSVIEPDLSPVIPNSPGVRRFMNLDQSFKTGFEINWSQRIAKGLSHQMGIAYTFAEDLEREEPLPEIAPLDFRYVLHGSYVNDRLQPTISFRHVLEQDRISEEYGESKTPSFSLVDIKLAFQVTDAFRVNAGVNNLFDENYYEHLSRSVRSTPNPIYAQGRNIFASLSVSF